MVNIHITQLNTTTLVVTMLIIVVRPSVSPILPDHFPLPDFAFSNLTKVGRNVFR